MPAYGAGRHEHGQNFLTDRRTLSRFVGLVARTEGPVVEIGPGRGALTHRLESLGRPLTAVEVDPRLAAALRRRAADSTTVVTADVLSFRFPREPHVVVGNLPFHLTTAILRRLLHQRHWTSAVLLVQWEVARRRAGVGGASMMTAQWWPWYDFGLAERVPRRHFRPVPGVDGGLLTVHRRITPLVPERERDRYRGFVHAVFTSRGAGLEAILARRGLPRDWLRSWLSQAGLPRTALPRDLDAGQWAELFGHMPGGRG